MSCGKFCILRGFSCAGAVQRHQLTSEQQRNECQAGNNLLVSRFANDCWQFLQVHTYRSIALEGSSQKAEQIEWTMKLHVNMSRTNWLSYPLIDRRFCDITISVVPIVHFSSKLICRPTAQHGSSTNTLKSIQLCMITAAKYLFYANVTHRQRFSCKFQVQDISVSMVSSFTSR